MNKKTIAVLVLFFIAAAYPVYAGWKTDLTRLMAKEKNYPAAVQLLETALNTVTVNDRPFVWLALAYCSHQLEDKKSEAKWITGFFEIYKGVTDVFPLTDKALRRKIGDYMRAWRRKYPLLVQTGLLKDSSFKSSRLPRYLTLAVEMGMSTHYRLVYKEKVVSAGIMKKGFNFIELPAAPLFERSDSHVFALDLKAGDLIVQKEIVLDIACRYPENSGQMKEPVRKSGFGVAMFIENRLVAYHKKSVKVRRLSPMETDKMMRRADRLTGRPPNPLDIEEKSLQRASIPVLAIPVLAYKYLIKPKLKKKKKIIKTFTHLEATFLTIDEDDIENPLDVEITMRVKPPGRGSYIPATNGNILGPSCKRFHEIFPGMPLFGIPPVYYSSSRRKMHGVKFIVCNLKNADLKKNYSKKR